MFEQLLLLLKSKFRYFRTFILLFQSGSPTRNGNNLLSSICFANASVFSNISRLLFVNVCASRTSVKSVSNSARYAPRRKTRECNHRMIRDRTLDHRLQAWVRSINRGFCCFQACTFSAKAERHFEAMRIYQSLILRDDRPSLVVDCRFLPLHTQRGINLAFLQLAHVISINKQRHEPWPLTFANFDLSDDQVRIGTQKYGYLAGALSIGMLQI